MLSSKNVLTLGVLLLWWASVAYFPVEASNINSGDVSGASNLDTAGYVPYVLSPGVLTIAKTANKDLFFDAPNGRLGVGCGTTLAATFAVCGSSSASIRARNTTSTGYIDMATGNASLTGYVAWFRANNTRNGFMGNDNGANITLNLENGSLFAISGGPERTVPVAVSALFACGASTSAARSAVTDATAPAVGAAVVGGGAIFATVHCSPTTNTWIVDGL